MDTLSLCRGRMALEAEGLNPANNLILLELFVEEKFILGTVVLI